jgi:hypothetical protein
MSNEEYDAASELIREYEGIMYSAESRYLLRAIGNLKKRMGAEGLPITNPTYREKTEISSCRQGHL